jgi:hypothetical protein
MDLPYKMVKLCNYCAPRWKGFWWQYVVKNTLKCQKVLKEIQTGVRCLPPAWLWSGARWCGSPAVWWVPSSPALPGNHLTSHIWHARPPPPPPASCAISPAWRQGSRDNFLLGSQHRPVRVKLVQQYGQEPVLHPLFRVCRAWVWCAHRTRMISNLKAY